MDRATALERLPEVYARALHLREEGNSTASIAQTLSVDAAAIDTLLELADAKLARILSDNPPSHPTTPARRARPDPR